MENVQEKSLFDDLVSADEPTPVIEQIENEAIEESNDVSETDVEVQESDVEPIETEEPSNETAEKDSRVEALYELLLENQIVAKKDDFNPTLDNLQEVLEELPEQFFLQAAESLHPDAREIAKALFYLGENATKDEVAKLFSSTPETLDLDSDEKSYNYLYDKLKGTKGFKDESKLRKYLDSLKEDESLVDTAKEIYEEETEEQKKTQQSKLEEIKEQKRQNEERIKQFYKNINDELKSLPWQDDKKKQIVDYLEPARVEEINKQIQSSPLAIIQLADIYSRFNPDTKQFDLSDFEIKTDSKRNAAMKDNAKKNKLDSILSKVNSGKNNTNNSSNTGFFNQFEKTN